jgi:hypothetical protein
MYMSISKNSHDVNGNRPEFSITGLQNSQSEHNSIAQGGEDTLEFYYNVQWAGWEKLRSVLEIGRALAAEASTGKSVVLLTDGFPVVMRAGGHGKGANYLRYSFDVGGVSVSIGDGPSGWVYFRVGSLLCMSWGLLGVVDHTSAMVQRLSGVICGSKLSRVDLAVDLAGIPMSEVDFAQRSDYVICAARESTVYMRTSQTTGIMYGRGATVVRIYNKALETGRRGDKWAWLVDNRYGGVSPEHALRVEIQLRRDALREMGVDSFEDYIERRAAIARYIVTSWIRFTDSPVDRKNDNYKRSRMSSFWLRVVHAFESFTGSTERVVRRVRRTGGDVQSLLKQAVGCIAAAQVLDVGYVAASAGDLLAEGFGAMRVALDRWGSCYLDDLADRAIVRLLCLSPENPQDSAGRFFGTRIYDLDYAHIRRSSV